MILRILIILIIAFLISCKPESDQAIEAEKPLSNYEKLATLDLPEKPNILWITYEDQMSTLGCFGDPVLDQKEGMLSVNCSTKGASIGYKIIREGIEPASWNVYTEPFEVKPGDTVKVVAHRIGYEPSKIIELKI
jgi:hypothetical protein